MSSCQFASVADTSLSPEGNINTTTDVLKFVGGVVNTCPAVPLWSFTAALKLDFFFLLSLLNVLFMHFHCCAGMSLKSRHPQSLQS